jgi:hypothetical protein
VLAATAHTALLALLQQARLLLLLLLLLDSLQQIPVALQRA